MNKYYYDFHIHSCLSPCGDESMTPNNIVNMALLKELDMIAVSDHNSYQNLDAVMKVAQDAQLLVIPGMEVETSEEIHVLCLMPDLDTACSFGRWVADKTPQIKNRKDIFGQQLILNEDDEIIGEYENLLLVATSVSLNDLISTAIEYGGAAVPAHVDRKSYSVLSNLGFMPPELPMGYIEISRHSEPELFLATNRKRLMKDFDYLVNSDAHYLGDISEREHYLKFKDMPSASDVIEKLTLRRSN